MRGSRRRLVGAGMVVVVVVVMVLLVFLTSRTRFGFGFGGDRVEPGNHALEAINYIICPFGEHWLLKNTCPRNTDGRIHDVGCTVLVTRTTSRSSSKWALGNDYLKSGSVADWQWLLSPQFQHPTNFRAILSTPYVSNYRRSNLLILAGHESSASGNLNCLLALIPPNGGASLGRVHLAIIQPRQQTLWTAFRALSRKIQLASGHANKPLAGYSGVFQHYTDEYTHSPSLASLLQLLLCCRLQHSDP